MTTNKHGFILCVLLLTLSGCATVGQDSVSDDDAPTVQSGGLDDVPDLTVSARQVTLAKPLTLTVNGRLSQVTNVVELVVSSAEPIEARGLDPVLVVGERVIGEYRYEKPNELVFIEPEPAKLGAGARVRFQWGLAPTQDQIIATPFVFDPLALPRVSR